MNLSVGIQFWLFGCGGDCVLTSDPRRALQISVGLKVYLIHGDGLKRQQHTRRGIFNFRSVPSSHCLWRSQSDEMFPVLC